MNNPDLDKLKKKLVSLRDARQELKQERDHYEEEKNSAKKHITALAKKENNQTLTDNEQEAMTSIKENFPEYFEEEEEEDKDEALQSESASYSPEFHERQRVAQIMEYLNQEIKANSVAMKKNHDEWKSVYKIISQKINNQSMAESSSASKSKSEEVSSVNAPEITTESVPETVAESSANKNPSDYIDSLPKQYNPLDDLGDD